MINCTTYFVSGIDTGIGKTIATGLLALKFKNEGKKVSTQKMVQTGCENISEDILTHRKIMNEPLNDFDNNGTTCPYLFKYPASPHLAARMENIVIDPQKIHSATKILEKHYEIIVLEGAGGLFVPLNDELFIIDYIAKYKYPLILVTSPRLGSINHTVLSAEACIAKGINICKVIYNRYNETDSVIANETKQYLQKYFYKNFPYCEFDEITKVETMSLS